MTYPTAETPSLPPHIQRFALLALALGGFTIGTTEFATMGILTNIADGLDVSIPAAGHTITAYALGVVIGAPIIAVLTARVSRNALVAWLMGAYAVANLLSALAPNIEILVLSRFFAGLPHGVFFGVGAVVGTAIVGFTRRGFAISMMLGGLTIANIIGVPLSSWAGQNLGWQATFVIVGVLGMCALAALLKLIPPVPTAPDANPRRELAALKNGRLWAMFAGTAVGFGGMFAVYSYVKPLVMFESGYSESAVPFILALFGIGMTAGTFYAGKLMDINVVRTVKTGFVLTSLSLVFLGLVEENMILVLCALFAVGFTSQLLALPLQGLLMDLSPGAPSLGAALCHSALNAANASGAFFGGLFIVWGFGYTSLAWLGLGLTVGGFIIVLAFLPRTPKHDINALLEQPE
ncbi:MFS transporter [Timonella sp. A28]|uniref:MFS transporter n=1 Tax=Timonella sp. A28 TaxID=3442640 RepID=UPI003EBFDBC5